jgi:hypothetical protein
MKRQKRRGAKGDGELSNPAWVEEKRLESAEQPIAPSQVGRPEAGATQDDQLVLEQEILRDHGSDATRAAQLRGNDGQVQQRKQEIPHVRVSVGQESDVVQRCRVLRSARELAFRDPLVRGVEAACADELMPLPISMEIVARCGVRFRTLGISDVIWDYSP